LSLPAPSQRLLSYCSDPRRCASPEIRSMVCPPSDMASMRPLPEHVAVLLRHSDANRVSRSALVVSHHLDGLLRIATPSILQPEPDKVHCVSSAPDLLIGPRPERIRMVTCQAAQRMPITTDNARRTDTQPFPAVRFTPLEELPSSAAGTHHCARCPLAVFVARYTRPRAWIRGCAAPDRSRTL
jgi:hypothetical protein